MAEVIPLRLCAPDGIEVLDQTGLPGTEHYLHLNDLESVCEAVSSLRVRGAPLLGLIGGCGMAIAGQISDASDDALENAARRLTATRPTAVDLGAMVESARSVAAAAGVETALRRAALWKFAAETVERQASIDRALGQHGAARLGSARTVLTHCNTGALATGGLGTALAVVRCAWEQGSLDRCYVTETRPLLQGARLTTWELARLGIPTTLLPDTAVASLIASGSVDAVVTGADRIAANGDTANKVGTYGIAAVAARHGVPMFIAAPRSTFDPGCADGAHIPIEHRDAREVGGFGEMRWSPEGLEAYNPAFDVTPASLITALITERGTLERPLADAIDRFCREP